MGIKCVIKSVGSKKLLSQLATFRPGDGLSARIGTSPMPYLVIGQAGIGMVDHILMSMLLCNARTIHFQSLIDDVSPCIRQCHATENVSRR